MRQKPRPQEIYRHFKGNLYQVLTVAKDAQTGEEMVVYQALYGDYSVWCRKLDDFCSQADADRYPQAAGKDRFVLVDPGALSGEEAPASVGTPEKKAADGAEGRGAFVLTPAEKTVEVQPSARSSGVMSKTIEQEAEELHMDPAVVAFLDEDTATGRLKVLEALRGRATNEMIDIMAMAAGLDIDAGEPWERFNELRDCLRTIERFETTRLRD